MALGAALKSFYGEKSSLRIPSMKSTRPAHADAVPKFQVTLR